MKRYTSSLFSILAVGFALATAYPSAGFAATGASDVAAAPNCADSEKMMSMNSMTHMKSTGNIDKDFAMAMTAHHDAMMAMAKMEVKCGSNPAAKKDAQKFIDDASAFSQQMRAVLYHT